MTRRPAAHNPVVYRKVARPAGAPCTVPGCGGFVLAGDDCGTCAFTDAYVREFIGYPEDEPLGVEWAAELVVRL